MPSSSASIIIGGVIEPVMMTSPAASFFAEGGQGVGDGH
jgi:hypothetical protein